MATLPGMRRAGGTSEDHPANKEVQGILDSLRNDIENRIGRAISELTAVTYKTQVVAGTNYFIKARVDGSGNHVHIRVYQSLPHAGGHLQVHSLQQGKHADDPIEYF